MSKFYKETKEYLITDRVLLLALFNEIFTIKINYNRGSFKILPTIKLISIQNEDGTDEIHFSKWLKNRTDNIVPQDLPEKCRTTRKKYQRLYEGNLFLIDYLEINGIEFVHHIRKFSDGRKIVKCIEKIKFDNYEWNREEIIKYSRSIFSYVFQKRKTTDKIVQFEKGELFSFLSQNYLIE